MVFETVHLECHQQRSFTLKMHQNRCRLGPRPRPHLGAYSAPTNPLGGLRGLRLRGEEDRGGEGLWTLTMLETD